MVRNERHRRRTRWLRHTLARHPWMKAPLRGFLKLTCVVAAVLDPAGLVFALAQKTETGAPPVAELPATKAAEPAAADSRT